ncbi:hypothetical protein U1Q18_003227 [Sarracenia purpurea var. burkii]
MEPQPPSPNYDSTVDTSRPFNSVKEAVAMFGEKFLAAEIFSSSSPQPKSAFMTILPKQDSPLKNLSPSSPMKPNDEDENAIADALKRLESELEETKSELKLLKERESETEVALASLNAEVHKNMSKIAGEEAAKAAAARMEGLRLREEEAKKRELVMGMEELPTLARILSFGEDEGLFGERKKKKKPIVPLVGDLFSRRKKSSTTTSLHSSLFSSTHLYLN